MRVYAIRYPCSECEYAATRAGDLKRHKQSKHQGIRYPCRECEYVATRKEALKIHKENKHYGIWCTY